MAGASSLPDPLLTHVVVSNIKPLQKTAHVETIDPTAMDSGLSDLYVPTLFAYRLADKSEEGYLQLVNRIKESLQKVLVPFFSFAGRWIVFPEEGKGRKLLCNDEGVPFVEAYVDRDMDAVVQTSLEFEAVPELQGYAAVGMEFTRLKQEVPPEGLPGVFVQVTRFKCGGVVLAVTFCHIHTDAKGFFNFMRAWSDLSRCNETAVKVDELRELAETDVLRDSIRQSSKGTAVGNNNATSRPWAMKAFEVTSSTMKSLKLEAKENKNGPGFVSTVDCIVADVWGSLARLPSSMLGGKDPTITMVVEGRQKFYDPPLPDGLNGNVLSASVPPRIPMEELQEMPVASIACKLREQAENTRMEDWHSLQTFKEIGESFRKCAVMSITSWLKFPLYEMDFGAGKPIFATRVSTLWNYSRPPAYVGTTYVGPPLPSSSYSVATVCVFSSPEILQTLERDSSFLSLFHGHQNDNHSVTG